TKDDLVGDCIICREWWATGRTASEEEEGRHPQPSLMRSSAHGLPRSCDVLDSGAGQEQHAVPVSLPI
ncbi:hypothetical protein BD310DRAFT_933342, partial [Dichomitus squalens]